MSCRECGAAQLVHDGVGSLVCIRCGTLADPTQSVVVVDHNDPAPTSSYAVPRTTKGWHLAKTKQDRDRKNTIAMSKFISSVLSRLNSPGLSPRAEAIFTQAMSKGRCRWGRKAKLAAGASIAIALREARRSGSLRDIAFLLDDSTVSLARTFQSVVSLLGFSLASADPAVHLPILQSHLHSITHPETPSPISSRLPRSLVSVLSSFPLQAAIRTATSLSDIISHHTPPLSLTNLPTPATACALLILGLEAEARAPLPHLGELARVLGTRFALSSRVVSSRYKIIYDQIEEWIHHVPWLDQFEDKGRGATAARSKVPKRAIVARGIKDVIQFHEEIWFSRTQNQQKIVQLDLESDSGDFSNGDDDEKGDDESVSVNLPTIASSSRKRGDESVAAAAPPPGKRRKKSDDAMQAAYRFLLNPLSTRCLDVAGPNGEMSMLLTHILTCSPDELSRIRGTPPTRLQLLAASRGGSTAEDIADEELFAVGELEGLLRSEQEREALRPLFELNWGEEISSSEEASAAHREPAATETKRGAKRIDMGALARLLGENDDGDGSDNQGALPDRDDDPYLKDLGDAVHHRSEHLTATEEVELVSDWRPASPDDGGFLDIEGDRYEEEV